MAVFWTKSNTRLQRGVKQSTLDLFQVEFHQQHASKLWFFHPCRLRSWHVIDFLWLLLSQDDSSLALIRPSSWLQSPTWPFEPRLRTRRVSVEGHEIDNSVAILDDIKDARSACCEPTGNACLLLKDSQPTTKGLEPSIFWSEVRRLVR